MNLRYYKKLLLSSLLVGGCLGHLVAQENTVDSSNVIAPLSRKDSVRYIGYGTQNPLYVTGSISTIKASLLEKNFNTNLANKLNGRLPGLTVVSSTAEPGLFNAKPGLYARGVNTYQNTGIETVSTEPLVIVDGFVSTFDNLVAEEIEEISLLKDASAAAVYGVRAANGVLLVTTKRGGISPLKINFSSQLGIGQGTSLPTPLDSYTYATLFNKALANTTTTTTAIPYTAAQLEGYQSGSNPTAYPSVNWYDELFRKTAPLSNYNLNFSGGDNTVRYFVMMNAVGNQTLLKNFGKDNPESKNLTYNRYNFRANLDVNVSKRLTATLLFGGSLEENDNPSNEAPSIAGNTLFRVRNIRPNAFPVYIPNGSVTSGGVAIPDGSFAGSTDIINPLAAISQTGYSTVNGRTLQSALKFKHELDFITEGLSATAGISFNNYFRTFNLRTRQVQTYTVNAANPNAPVYGTVIAVPNTILAGVDGYTAQFRTYSIQSTLNYDKTFGVHNISAMLGFNADNNNLTPEGAFTINNILPFKSNNLFNRITYVNSGKYIAEFSSSYMGTETFEKGNQYGFFPAGSLGWIASNENFLKNSKVLSFLKFRGSYGLVGSDRIGGRFLFEQRFPAANNSAFFGDGPAGQLGFSEGRLANPNITWEKEKRANIGIESVFFNQLSLSVDLFKHDRYDLLPLLTDGGGVNISNVVPQYVGYSANPLINQGKVTNRGFEAVLGFNSKPAKKFSYFAQANVFYNENKIVNNGEVFQVNPGLYRSGNSINTRYALRALGLFQTDAEATAGAKPAGYTAKAGDIKYEDVGGPNGVKDGIIDGNDAQPLSNSNLDVPKLTVGLHSGFQYKRFDFDFVIQAVTGRDVYLGGGYYSPFSNRNNAVSEVALNTWTPENTSAEFPRLTLENQNNFQASSFYERDGSFIKLRSAELGYSLKGELMKRVRLNTGRIFISGTNLLTGDRLKYSDAEVLNLGYPPIRTFSLGFKVGL